MMRNYTKKEIEDTLKENERLKKENESMKKILNSKRFRMAEKVANVYNGLFPVETHRRKLLKGAAWPARKIMEYRARAGIRKVEKIIHGKKIVIAIHSIPWNTPLRQRPHHLAKCLSRHNDVMVIYLEPDEQLRSFRVIDDNFITINSWDVITGIKHFENSDYYFFFNNVSNIPLKMIKKIDDCGYKLVYEYIDEFHEDISGSLVNQLETWNELPKMDLKLVLASAEKLYNEAKRHFKHTKVLLSKNAVIVEDFNYHNYKNSAIPDDLVKITKQQKPIVGYYGALAHWLDYDLISGAAKKNKDLNFVLIGVNYQNALGKLDQSIDNVFYLGPKNYNDLPRYSSKFDCAIIPFGLGEIAKGTSPVKLFEYMAMGLPTVGTRDLNECRGYDYVYLAKNKNEFSEYILKAISEHKNDKARERLLEQAQENSWQSRADDIIKELK